MQNREQSTDSTQLRVGDLAPNVTLAKTTGECVTLAELFGQRRTLLVFLRHFG